MFDENIILYEKKNRKIIHLELENKITLMFSLFSLTSLRRTALTISRSNTFFLFTKTNWSSTNHNQLLFEKKEMIFKHSGEFASRLLICEWVYFSMLVTQQAQPASCLTYHNKYRVHDNFADCKITKQQDCVLTHTYGSMQIYFTFYCDQTYLFHWFTSITFTTSDVPGNKHEHKI